MIRSKAGARLVILSDERDGVISGAHRAIQQAEQRLTEAFAEATRAYGVRRFARKVGVSAAYISDVCRGNRRVTRDLAERAAEILR